MGTKTKWNNNQIYVVKIATAVILFFYLFYFVFVFRYCCRSSVLFAFISLILSLTELNLVGDQVLISQESLRLSIYFEFTPLSHTHPRPYDPYCQSNHGDCVDKIFDIFPFEM